MCAVLRHAAAESLALCVELSAVIQLPTVKLVWQGAYEAGGRTAATEEG